MKLKTENKQTNCTVMHATFPFLRSDVTSFWQKLRTANTSLHKLHTAHCTLHTAHYTLHTAHCTLHTAHSTLNTAHCTEHTAHCKLHTAHCTLHKLYKHLTLAVLYLSPSMYFCLRRVGQRLSRSQDMFAFLVSCKTLFLCEA